VNISGISLTEDESCKLTLISNIHKITNDRNVINEILLDISENNEILPIEAQIVGLVLENEVAKAGCINKEYYFEKFGGKTALIKKYFQHYLDASPDRYISLQVLFSLSVKTKLREQLNITQISSIVHQSKEDVSMCLNFFSGQGLVRTTNMGEYELSHDYLAEKFHELSGIELNPIDRDNILFFGDEISKRTKSIKDLPLIPITFPINRKSSKIVFSDYFMAFLSVIMTIRLFTPLYDWDWTGLDIIDSLKKTQSIVDVYYLPVFVSHFAWSIYITRFYKKFYYSLNESKLATIFSKLTVINCTFAVLISVFIPYFFVFSIGIGGLVFGLKLLQISRFNKKSKVSYSFFIDIAIPTIFNLVIVILIGSGLIYFINTMNILPEIYNYIMIVMYFLSIILTYFMIVISSNHITHYATSKMLALNDRGKIF